MRDRILSAAAMVACTVSLHAAPISQSTFTDVVKDVNVVAAPTRAATPAKVNAEVKAPDLVRTGAGSRAELTASDQTITRIGANTVFSFEPVGRNLRLEQGSVLFQAPAGKGGGNIKTGGASAAVLGTTIIVAATPDGGFKLIILEGKGRATLPNGNSRSLNAGQMVFVLPGGSFSPVLNINLGALVAGSQLVNGFSRDLPSLPRIRAAIKQQDDALARGRAVDTGLSANAFAVSPRLRHGLDSIDHVSYQTAAHPPLTAAQITALAGQQPNGGKGRGGPGGAGVVAVSRGK
ncbi:MAG TPA: FecR family protein [Candidatus Saccharimonadales bacterium]|nr:FecR family protein [Candidatus Saccharimonadales bacterium]